MSTMPTGRPTLAHEALFYRDTIEYATRLGAFVAASLEAGRPVLVAIPADRLGVVTRQLGDPGPDLETVDMTELGRNPGRILPAVHAFVDSHQGRAVSFVGEPIWPGRNPAEVAEATRYEALINRALANTPLHALCPYQVDALPSAILSDAYRTHPLVRLNGQQKDSDSFADPELVWRSVTHLPPPPPNAITVVFDARSLAAVREAVQAQSELAHLPAERIDDLVVATSEVAGNSIRHAGGSGTLQTWARPEAVVCEVRDRGHLTDPLVGRSRPGPVAERGWGLWLANQLCDLVQLHSGTNGTTVRLHIRR